MAYQPICRPKKVLIVGGGVAGCEAARVLAIRGHEPHLFEAGSQLGGNLIPGGVPDFKEDDHALAAWYARELERLSVPVTLNHKVTASEAMSGGYDAVIVATGSTPRCSPWATMHGCTRRQTYSPAKRTAAARLSL